MQPYNAIAVVALVDVVAAGTVIATLVVTAVVSASIVDAIPVADLCYFWWSPLLLL